MELVIVVFLPIITVVLYVISYYLGEIVRMMKD